jgi:4-oxalocrotonate tautomerase
MPYVHAEIWQGIAPETREAVAKALTDAMVRSLGCPADAVTVILSEVEKKNWFIGARSCEELFPQPPA